MTTRKDQQRIAELIHQGSEANDPTKDIIRRIVEEMPHLTADEIADVAMVHAEECRLDASVQLAQANAAKQIAEIIKETQRMSRRPYLRTEEAHQILSARAEHGDKRASELLDDFGKAMLIVGLGE